VPRRLGEQSARRWESARRRRCGRSTLPPSACRSPARHGGGDPAEGRPAVREAIVVIFAQAPDLRFDRKTVYFGDGHIVTEYEMCGTAEGVSFACDGVDVFALSDGRIARKDTYLDWGSLQQQLGRDPVAQSQPA